MFKQEKWPYQKNAVASELYMRLIIVDRGNILYRGFNDDKDINDDKWVYFVTRTITLKLLLLTKFNLPMTTPKTILYFNPLFSTKSKLP